MDNGSYDEHQDYCEMVSGAEPELLQNLTRSTYLQCIHPRMISGRFLGRTLSMISKLVRPNRILEIGTYTGYSALCLAEGLQEDGELITIDINDELVALQDEYFSQSKHGDSINRKIGAATEVLPTLSGPFQLIFIDADKENYMSYFRQALELCEVGSLLLIDNMLWEGKVLNPKNEDLQTQSILALTQFISENNKLDQVLLPLRDGLMLVRVNEL